MKKIFILLFVILLTACNSGRKSDAELKSIEMEPVSGGVITPADSIKYAEMTKELNERSGIASTNTNVESVPQPIENIQPTFAARPQNDGTFFYQIDSIFTIDVTSRVEARIIKKVYDSTPEDVVELFYRSPNGTIRRELIQTGNIMDVNLICLNPNAFTITKISNDQPVDENTFAEWIWGVTPKKVGKENLILKVTVKSNGVSRDKIVFDKVINVENQPKKYFSVLVEGDKLKNLSPRTITLTITETDKDKSSFKWRGTGAINIEFKRPSNFTINKEGDLMMNDNKGLYITKWTVTPNTKLDSVETKIKVIGDNEQIIIYDKYIIVDKDIKKLISNFVDKSLQSWYWIFTTLLIPLYHFIKKKYFPDKKIFTGKKRVVKPKTVRPKQTKPK